MKKIYRNKRCPLDQLSESIWQWFQREDYEVQYFRDNLAHILQARKESWLRQFLGARRVFTVIIQGEPDNFEVDVGLGRWAYNVASTGIIGLVAGGGVLFFSSAVLAAWSRVILDRLWVFIDAEIMRL
jgi:hypothetical protein